MPMRYSDDIIEEVRSRNDIVEVVSQHVKMKRRGDNYFGLCPFHNEKSPSFSVSASKQMFYCFGCGAGGNVFAFVMQYENLSFPEALSFLAERAGITLPAMEYSAAGKQKNEKREALMEINKLAAAYYYYQLKGDLGRPGYLYFSGRGCSDDIIRSFGLGYAPESREGGLYRYLQAKKGFSSELLEESGLFVLRQPYGFADRFHGRVMFPIMNASSKVIGFGGRVLDDGKPKYLNSPENLVFDKGRNLYGLHIARRTREDRLILCEGYMDVIAMHQAGFTNAVASLGTALTDGHAALIKRYVSEALLLYDSDQAGVRAALRAIPILGRAGVSARVVNLKPSKDPDEFIRSFGAEAFRKRLDEARDAFLFQVDQAAASVDMHEPQGQNRFFDQCAILLLGLDDELERSLYLEAIVREYQETGVSTSDLRHRLQALAMKGVRKEYLPETMADSRDTGRNEPDRNNNSSGYKHRQGKENGSEKAQKLMLTWLVNWPSLFDLVSRYLQPEDFTNSLYKDVAEMLFEQYRKGDVNPARLLNVFMDSEEQREVAGLFNASIQVETSSQMGQAFADAVWRIREAGFEAARDLSDMQAYIARKKELENLKNRRQELADGFIRIVSQDDST